MKRLFLFFALLVSFVAEAQPPVSTPELQFVGTTAFSTTNGRIRYNTACNCFVFRYGGANVTPPLVAAPGAGQAGQSVRWNNGSSSWEYFTPASSFALTNGSGTTANGTAVDLGGTLTSTATVTTTGFGVLFSGGIFAANGGGKQLQLDPTNGIEISLGSDDVGDIFTRGTVGFIQRIPAVATGNALISGGVSTVPSWGKIGLTTHVSGILPIANGGTGSSTQAWWGLTGTSTLGGVATINSNAAEQHVFGGTWTATGATQSHIVVSPTITARATASDEIKGIEIMPTINAAANNQILTTLDLTTTYNQGAFTGLSLVGIKTNGQIDISASNAIKSTFTSSGGFTRIQFFQSTTAAGSIVCNGSAGSNPSAMEFRTDRAAGNILFSTAAAVPAGGINANQRWFLGGNFTPTAWAHLAAGVATASGAPLKFTSGPLTTTPESGAREFDNSHYVTTAALNRLGMPGKIAGFNAVVNNSGTSETDLFTYTTKANTLNATGEEIEFTGVGKVNDVTSTAQLKFYFAGTAFGDTGALTVSGVGAFTWRAIVKRTGASTASASVQITTPTASTAVYTNQLDLAGLTFSGTNIVKITGTAGGAGGGSNDITAIEGRVLWFPAANN